MTTENAHFFIVGSGRSGTTLLRLLLSNHSRICVPPETWFLAPLVEELPLDACLSAAQVQRAVEIITTHYRWPDMRIDACDLERQAMQLDSPRLRHIVDLVYRRFLDESGKPRVGDKTPPYIAIVPQLAALYPGARFIHLIRDGRDVAISFIELGYECRFYDGARFEWIASMERARVYRMSEYARQILEIKYEDLVARPEPTLHRICEFLGESFEPRMLELRPQIDAVPLRERTMHTKLDRPLSSDSIGIWRHKLSGIECFWMEACLHDYLAEVGYELRFARPLWRPLLAAAGLLLRSAAPLLDRGIPFLKRRDLMSKEIYF